MRICRGTCGRELVSWIQWRDTDPAVRKRDRHMRTKHDARGLCNSCRRAVDAAGTLIDFDRQTRTRDEVLDEWRRLFDPELSIAANVRLIAPRVGMSVPALDKAIQRARRDGLDTSRAAA